MMNVYDVYYIVMMNYMPFSWCSELFKAFLRILIFRRQLSDSEMANGNMANISNTLLAVW